jgi:SAM-dependent methyltransferase
VSYEPRGFWEQRLREQFDLRGTGEFGMSIAYNRACYALRLRALERALRDAGIDPAGRRVLDVGCGTGFFTSYYVGRGAAVTGIDITSVSIERLAAQFPQSRFVEADVGEGVPGGPYDVINAFDVLYHITDDARWERAVLNLGRAVAPGGVLLVTDLFESRSGQAEHNTVRPLARYRDVLERAGLRVGRRYPTHLLLNRELGAFRPLNRLPWLLYGIDRTALALGVSAPHGTNQLLTARRPG